LTERGEAFSAHVVSYADDFVILSRGRAARALTWTKAVMTKLRLTLNEAKTSRASPGSVQPITTNSSTGRGIVAGHRVGVSNQADFANEEISMLTQTAPAELPVGHLGFGAMRVRLAPHRQAGRRSGRGRPRASCRGP
jgi:hypothetical protein